MELCRLLQVRRSLLYYWLERYRKEATAPLGGDNAAEEAAVEQNESPARGAAKRIAELERKVGQQTLEVDFLRRAFKRVKEPRQASSELGAPASTERSAQ